jgi:hypothetical protein
LVEAKQAKKLLREEKKKYREEQKKASKEECRRRAFGPMRKRYQCASCEKWSRTEGYRDKHFRRCRLPAAKKRKVISASVADMQKAWFATGPPLSAIPGAVQTMGGAGRGGGWEAGGAGGGGASVVGAGNEGTPPGINRVEGASTLEEGAATLEGAVTPVEEKARRILDGSLNPFVQRLPMGWARKSGVERCDKETRERRTEWVRRFYAERVRRNLRANEYEAEDQLIKEYPDDDSMWLGSAALKSVFGKLSAARKEEAKKKAAVTAGGQVGGAQQVAGGDVEGPQVGAQVGAQEGATEAEDEEDELEALLEYQIPPDVGINYDSDDSGDEGETMETEEEEEIVEAGAVDTCL